MRCKNTCWQSLSRSEELGNRGRQVSPAQASEALDAGLLAEGALLLPVM